MTYREAAVREKISPPWSRGGIARPAAIGLGAVGTVSSATLAGLVHPVAGLAALLVTACGSISLFLVGGGDSMERTRDPRGPEDPLRRAGLRPVGWTEWRGERDGFPIRVVYSAFSLRARIEVALGSALGLRLAVHAPAIGSPEDCVGPFLVHSDRPEVARAAVASAQARCGELPFAFQLEAVTRILQTTVIRFATPDGYGVVLSALDFTVALARALADQGEGLAPFGRVVELDAAGGA